jgi:hypothetical protein
MKKYLLMIILFAGISGGFAGINSDFAWYMTERSSLVYVAPCENAFISFEGGNLTVLIDDSTYGELVVIGNKMNRTMDMEIFFEGWSGPQTDLSISDISPDSFTLLPGETEDIYGEVEAGENAVAGTYYAYFRIVSEWSDGEAEVNTSDCPLEIRVIDPNLDLRKELLYGETEDLHTNTSYEWGLRLYVNNSGMVDMTDIEIKDVIPGELELISLSPSKGSTDSETHGSSTHITWTLDLVSGEGAYLDMVIETREKEVGHGMKKCGFTSPGDYCLNEGAEVKGFDIYGKHYSIEDMKSNKICIEVHENENDDGCDK